MGTPINFPPQQVFPTSQASSQSTPSGGETAFVFNFNSPAISHGGPTGPANNNNNGGSNGVGGSSFNQAPDVFQKKNNTPFTPNPNSSPAQQIQDAYANALTVRNQAEQARTDFLNLANQLENQAISKANQQAPALPSAPASDNPFTQSASPLQPANPAPPVTFQAPPPPTPQADPTQQFQQQLQNLQQPQQQAPAAPPAQPEQPQANAFQQPQQPGFDPAAQQQMLMQQMAAQGQQPQMDPYQQQMLMQQMAAQAQQQGQPGQMDPYQQQLLQQQMMQQQMMNNPAYQQQMMQQPQAQPSFAEAGMMPPGGMFGAPMSVADLNARIAQPQTPDEKLDALQQIANRQVGDRTTYELLKREIVTPMQGLPQETADAIRQQAIISLGSLNSSPVNKALAGKDLYGMDGFKQILTNPKENPLVKASVVAALGSLNRPQDKEVKRLLDIAAKEGKKNNDVQTALNYLQQQPPMVSAQA